MWCMNCGHGQPEARVTLVLPWPPSVNDYWGSRVVPGRKGRKAFVQRFVSRNGKRFQGEVKSLMTERFGETIRPVRTRLGVFAVLHPPTRGVYDLGNFDKAMMDALTAVGVWADDSQIDDQRFVRGAVVPGGRVELTIWEIKDQQARLFEPHEPVGIINADN